MTANLDLNPRLIGARVPRVEDGRLTTGRGRYLDDLEVPGTLHLTIVRSPHAHAQITSIDATRMREAYPDALVFTGGDCRQLGLRADIDKPGAQHTFQPVLAADVVRFAGEPVAAVLTGDPYRSEDAAELLDVEYEPLKTVLTIDEALDPSAPVLHPGWRDNVFVRRERGDGDVEATAREADLIVRRTFRTHRHTGVPMENRGCLAQLDPTGTEMTLWSSTQLPHMVRSCVAAQIGWQENRLRVVAPDVGGGFGVKGGVSIEEVLVPWLTMRTQRPVKWVEDRREHLQGSIHARDHRHELEAHVRHDGTVLGVRARIVSDSGAYSVYPWTGGSDAGMAANVLLGPYDIPNYRAEDVSVTTNKCPLGTYRGVGRPSACFSMERLLDEVARELGMDPIELRRRNVVRTFPYRTATGLVYDSGSYAECLERMQELLGERPVGEGIGVGVALFCEQTAHGTPEFVGRGMPIVAGYQSAMVEMDPQGTVTVHTGLQSHGQGMETTLAQIAADVLGLPLERVTVHHGDSFNPYAMGTWGSRGSVLGGGSTALASTGIRDKLLQIAAHNLEIDADQLEVGDGRISVRGVPTRGFEVATLARWALQEPQHLPPGMTPGLQETAFVDGVERGVFSNSCHGAVVRVDAALGTVELLRYVVIEDCGRVINPIIVEGQAQGGTAQGIGGALLEELIYDEAGQLVTSTFADYLLPSMTD
ncbi:MAG: xanthine dehydrogenase family protein molybdopterin-binding subunit, partial [bacterium]|nr:xanthine dehydrogenase family protein molybdopterin-binding subunit [bacterium]